MSQYLREPRGAAVPFGQVPLREPRGAAQAFGLYEPRGAAVPFGADVEGALTAGGKEAAKKILGIEEPKPEDKIMGLSKPVFYGLAAVVVAGGLYFALAR